MSEVNVLKNLKIDLSVLSMDDNKPTKRHPKCRGWYDEFSGDYDCDYYSVLSCDDCKYGAGEKDPEAKCNQI